MSGRPKPHPVSSARTSTLKGRKIRLSCTLNSKTGILLGKPGAILTIGRDVSIIIAKQLLAGDSARLIEKKPPQPPPDVRIWPDPVKWGHFDPKGKAGQTIAVHIPVYLDGKSQSSLKLCASSTTFRELSDHWFQTVSERRLGMLAIKAIRAGSRVATPSQGAPWPSGIDVQRLVVGRQARARSIPVTLHLNHEGKEHCLKFLAYRDVFQRLAGFHTGDEASDVRFGDLLRNAMWAACGQISRSEDPGKESGKLFPSIAWKTAAWLGPALLDPMRTAEKDRPDIYAKIQNCMAEEAPKLKCTPRNMAGFLVDKNWRNWTTRRDLSPEWPTATTPIRSPGRKNEHSSIDFWDEIFSRQLKLKRFPWPQLRRTSSERFKHLTFYLPKPFNETVQDILMNLNEFILFH